MRRRFLTTAEAGILPASWRASFSSGKTKSLPGDARGRNLALVLQLLYRDGPLSRADLARSTGLTKVTISDLVSSLLEEGVIRELGPEQHLRPGKPAVLLDLSKDVFAIACVDLSGGKQFQAVLLDLDFTELSRLSVPRDGRTGEAALSQVVELVDDLLASATLPVVGISVGSPGVVSTEGVVKTSLSLGWHDVPLGRILEAHTGLPTTVENDANAATIAESAVAADTEDLLFVSVWSGIGAGLLLGGQLVRGQSFSSGEIGRLTVGPGDTSLEQWISLPALQERLEAADDSAAVLSEAGERLAVALAPIVAMLNLRTVVLSGPADIVDGDFTEGTRRNLLQRTMAISTESLQVVSSRLGDDVVLLGCAWLALNQFLENRIEK